MKPHTLSLLCVSGLLTVLCHSAAAQESLMDIYQRALQKAMEKRFRRGLKHFSWFIHRFTTPVMQRLFCAPRNDWKLEQAVISMLAGDVFDNPRVRWRLYLFRLVYALNAVAIAPQALRGWLDRRRQVRAAFAGDTLHEGNP